MAVHLTEFVHELLTNKVALSQRPLSEVSEVITRKAFIALSSKREAITRVHPVHLMNAEQRPAAADPLTKRMDLDREEACVQRPQPSPLP